MWLDVALPGALIAGRRQAWPDIAARLLPVLLPWRVLASHTDGRGPWGKLIEVSDESYYLPGSITRNDFCKGNRTDAVMPTRM